MKKIIAIVTALVTLTTSASAESFTLHSYKHWQVKYVDNPQGQPFCSAEVTHRDGVIFGIAMDHDGGNFFVYNPRAWYEQHYGTVNMQVDRYRNRTWDAQAKDEYVYIQPTDAGREIVRRFVTELERGRALRIDTDGDNYADYKISLQGSRAAMLAVMECVDRL